MNISECTNSKLWNEFVNRHGTIHHLYEWKNVNEDTFCCPCINLACWEGDRIIAIYPYIVRGRWPLRWYVSPNDFGGGPIGDTSAVRALIHEVNDRAKKQWVIMNEIRYANEGAGLPHDIGYEMKERKNLVVDIDRAEEDIWNSLRKKMRNHVRQSVRQGIKVSVGSVDNLTTYLSMAKKQREAIGYKGRSDKFIYALFKYLDTTLFLARKENRIVGGCIYIQYKGRVSGIHATRDIEMVDLRIGASLHWNAIRHFQSMGCREYDFLSRNDNHVVNGEAIVHDDIQSLHFFKMGFRPQELSNYDITFNFHETGRKMRSFVAMMRNQAIKMKSHLRL